jgi:hypothetical protein
MSISALAASSTASASASTEDAPISSQPIWPNWRAGRSASPTTRTTCPA